MKQKKSMIVMSIVALVLSSFMIAGNAGAMYMGDGAVPTGTGGWKTPNDMVCILGVHMNGNLDIVPGINNSRDCIYYNTGLTGLNPVDITANSNCGAAGTLPCNVAANCTGTNAVTKGTITWNATDLKCYDSAPCTVADFAGGLIGSVTYPANDGAKHALATSICVDALGNGISLKDLDRTAQMCAAKGGIWKQTSATAPVGFAGTFPTPNYGGSCVAYTRQFAGQSASGAPLTFGAKGTSSADAGYCFSSMRMQSATTKNGAPVSYTTAATCPSAGATTAPFNANAAYDWAFSSSNCTYAKGAAGILNGALTKANGTTIAAGTFIDLATTYTTMGDCLANGGSWTNWFGNPASFDTYAVTGGTARLPAWDYTRQAPDADNGCLHCHSNVTQYNGPAERYKDSYLMTGHKNMLRKVIAGMVWAGPDGVVYTKDTAGHPIDFMTAGGPTTNGLTPATVGGGPLYYIFGDWMAIYPDAVGPSGDTTSYSCAACHTTGYNDSANPGVLSIGTPGYASTKPGDYGDGYVSSVTAGNKWDMEGINCSRCHNAAVGPINATQIAASAFTTTAPHSGGMGALAAGVGRNNLCFGCHQSIAKNWPAQGGAVGGTAQYDPTLIPTGISHGAASGRDFNGHVLGNSFLNSVHARYAGVNSNAANGGIKLNALGKYDLFDAQPTATNTALEYGSVFKGYTCWQGPTGNSPAKTKADGTEITIKSECESLYGVGSWRPDTGTPAIRDGIQGTCTTCHDVHNSLFVASQSEKAIRKECIDCHQNNASTFATDAKAPQVASFNHPQTPGTPFDTTIFGNDSCSVCHMATQAVKNGNQNTMPAHVWRINTDPSYNTFPTADQFNGTNGATKDRNAQVAPEQYLDANGNVQTYAKAVWVDIDMACGQCHGGSLGASAVVNGAPYKSKTELAGYAANMHNEDPVPNFTWVQTSGTKNANFDASLSVCPVGATCSYSWDFGDGSNGTGQTISHSYSTAVPGVNTYSATLTVSSGINSTPLTHNVTVNLAPTVAETSFGATNVSPYMTVNLQDSSTAGSAITVNWGDGSLVSNGSAGGLFTHIYTKINTYTVVHAASVGGIIASENLSITVPVKSPVSGNVTSKAGVPLQSVSLTLKLNGVTKGITSTDASGNFTFINITPGTYTVTAAKAGYTFASPAATLTVATGAVTGVNFSSSN